MKFMTGADLSPGDILLKRIPDSFISKMVGTLSSRTVSDSAVAHTKTMHGIDPTQFCHAALAMGPSELMEFDEAGSNPVSGLLSVVFAGAGMVHSQAAALAARPEPMEYVVFRCANAELARRAWKKALTIRTYTETGSQATRPSYGLGKALGSALFKNRGATVSDEHLRRELAKIKGESNRWFETNRANFFCSHFVTFVYLWAANDMTKTGSLGSVGFALGIEQAQLTPAELCVRMLANGGNFAPIGALSIGGVALP
jgi:hypothetical protein